MLREWAPNPRLVVGMSLGGLTALRLAASEPDLVPELVLVDVTPSAPERHEQMTQGPDGHRGARAGRPDVSQLRRDARRDGGRRAEP